MNFAPAGSFFSARIVPPMLLDDLGRDGEAQPGAALLGREIGQKEALPHLVGQPRTGVGDA